MYLFWVASSNRFYEFELHHYARSCTLCIDIYHAGLNTGFSDDCLHLPGDVVEAIVGRCADLDGLLHYSILFIYNLY